MAMPPASASVTLDRAHFRMPIRSRQHEYFADEPPRLEGTDTAPTPIELLLGSIASCKAVTVRMYADRKGMPLERVHATARYDASSTPPDAARRIEVELVFEGDLDDDAKARLVEIAEKCAVQKIITGDLEVVCTNCGCPQG